MPEEYVTTGGNSSSNGFLVQDENGDAQFQEIDIYNISDGEAYISPDAIEEGTVLVMRNQRRRIQLEKQRHCRAFII